MKFERKNEKKMCKEIRLLPLVGALLAFICISSFLHWLIGGAHWSWVIVSLESIVVFLIVRWRVSKDFERYCLAREFKIADEVRTKLLTEQKEKEKEVLEVKTQKEPLCTEDRNEFLTVGGNSFELKLSEKENEKNPWLYWFEPTCQAFAEIIRQQEKQPRYQIKKEEFESLVFSYGDENKEGFSSAYEKAWKCVPKLVKYSQGRPSKR